MSSSPSAAAVTYSRKVADSLGDSLVRYVTAGAVFGVVLVKGEVISWYRIIEMFRFESFHMYGILGSAAFTAFLSLQLLQRLHARSLSGEEIEVPPKEVGSGRRYLFGGVIFGVGWALTGACPGPLFALIGTGGSVFIAVAVAAVLGTWTYGFLRPRLPH